MLPRRTAATMPRRFVVCYHERFAYAAVAAMPLLLIKRCYAYAIATRLFAFYADIHSYFCL